MKLARTSVPLLCLGLPVLAQAGDFFAVKNENPLLRGIYLPLPVDSRGDAPAAFSAMLTAENTTNVENRGTEHLFVDGEATTLRLAYDAPLGADWRYRLSLPITRDAGGILDRAIERWHAWFGLPRGQRPYYPRNQLGYFYVGNPSAPANTVRIDQPHTGIGDLSAEFGWSALDDPSRSLSLWGGLELPTGSAAHLTGNGAVDASLWAHAEKRYARFHFGAEAGIVQAFGDDVFGGAGRRTSAFVRGAATWIAGPRWSWRLQVEGQTARIKDTELRFLGRSVVLSGGAEVALNRRWRVEFGLSEDAAVNTAPDVTFFVGLKRAAALR